jgi:6-pyruvoyltetrahydropterin/6-carboxytetrahydropterin synthase
MYQVTTLISFCYGHRLLNYDGKCRHLHGHNGRVEVELATERLDDREMVRDFGEVKAALKQWIDATLDHKMVLRRDDPALPMLRQLNEPVYVIDANPTAETLARIIFEQAKSMGFPVTMVRLWETDTSVATYRATL